MQDFDFGKHYRSNQRDTGVSEKASPGRSSFKSKIIFLASVISVAFIAGVYTGIFINDHKVVQGDELRSLTNNVEANIVADIHPDQSVNTPAENTENRLAEELESDKSEYLIMAKIYSSMEKAQLHGASLVNAGLPVFLTENGQKVKVYVGPVSGADGRNWSMLSKVKSFSEFQGAIMYKK
ncbi:MAG: hypothetical protein ABUK01_04205 [Leptospirales bacterium]